MSFHRTLIRFTYDVVLPSWNWRETLKLHKDQIPKFIRDVLPKGKIYRCHAFTDMSVDDIGELRFKDWELF